MSEKLNPLDVAREIFPDMGDDELDYMLWEYTGYPSFFNSKEPVSVQIRRQLQRAKDNPNWHPFDDMLTECEGTK